MAPAMRYRGIAALLAATTAVVGLATPADAAARKFSDCNAMHKLYVNGVAKSAYTATHPTPSWIRIKAPAVGLDVHTANEKLDRDGDGIACEVSR